MKKIIFLLLAFLLINGCKGIKPGTNEYIESTPVIITAYPRVVTLDIEGHRYVVVYSSTGCGIVHAENCQCRYESLD